ncbi:24149_t:CDS:2 [Dentiscutata erythropus]|uniref:24149_t:CDS:1 n=1 Tax=Dentiscutata erythropus TaxID=1348616 RepID=A0A9N9B8R2_9GLOM|nr:24149_t:CDS:2 [Dentiscutata erythropus]
MEIPNYWYGGIIQAISNWQIGLSIITELVCGFILPGRLIANSMQKRIYLDGTERDLSDQWAGLRSARFNAASILWRLIGPGRLLAKVDRSWNQIELELV